MTDWTVERAGPDDAEEMVSLYRQVWGPYRGILPDPLLQDRISTTEEIIGLMDTFPYFIVRSEGRIIGIARATFAYETCYLERMVVDAEHTRMGVGTALVDHIVDHAREKSANKVFLNTSSRLSDSIAFYERMGFVRCGLFHKHFWGENVVFFELLIR
jgi:GNAT superfamily N-acetyltransferase